IPESDTSRDLNINIFIAEINKQFSSGKGGGGQPPRINIGEILIEQSQFSYQTSKDSIKNGFDYNHFRLALDEGDVNGFQVIGDTIQFQLNSLLAKDEKTGLNVTNFSTYFRISQQSMEFLGLNMTANQSHISDTIIFKYKSQADLSDFNNLVTIDAKLKDTKLYPEDLSFFTTGVERWKEPLLVSGRFRGKVSRFTLRPMTIAVGSSLITGSLEMDGLPSIRETFITARLNPSQVYARDLAFLLPDNVNRNIAAFNKIQFKGNFTGFVDDFVADGDFETRFGRVQSDINYKISEVNIDQSSYRGKLQLTDFDLGAFLRDTINFQKVTLNGTINGKGFTKITADFKLTGSVEKIGLLGYPYTNIVTNARFANQFFNGDIKVDDPNLQFTANGSIDLRDDRNLINMEAKLDTALLHELHLSKDEIFLQSYVDIDSKGLELDSIVGTAFFKKTLLQFKDESIRFDSMRLISENEKGNRRLTLKSSLADLSLHGNYYYSTLFNDIQKLVHEFILNIKNDPVAIRQYYETKPKSTQAYQVDVKGTVHDVNALLQVLDVPLSASRETQVEGLFSTGLNSTLHVYSTIDTVKVSDQIFTANEIEFNGSKFRDSTQVLAQLTVNSERQYLAKNVTTKNLFLEGIWNKDHIDLDFDVDQEGYDNSLRLKWEVDFLKDSTILKIAPSTVKILGEKWTIDNQNQLAVAGREWTIHNLGLTNGIQSVKVDGAISHDPTKRLKVDIQHFNLAFLNLLSTEKFSGELNAEVVGRDLYADIFLENILSVDSLTVNNFFVGDIKGNNTRDPRSNQVQIDLTVDRFSYRIVDIKGFYDPEDKDNPLHTKAILEKANLKLLEPI
ncbi:MAG: hypothetical protein K2U26_08095, partial [Cyclobacteriaceae bacterium]|nr:hypothetical protein [Cyclobacteriaceae bacterium]